MEGRETPRELSNRKRGIPLLFKEGTGAKLERIKKHASHSSIPRAQISERERKHLSLEPLKGNAEGEYMQLAHNSTAKHGHQRSLGMGDNMNINIQNIQNMRPKLELLKTCSHSTNNTPRLPGTSRNTPGMGPKVYGNMLKRVPSQALPNVHLQSGGRNHGNHGSYYNPQSPTMRTISTIAILPRSSTVAKISSSFKGSLGLGGSKERGGDNVYNLKNTKNLKNMKNMNNMNNINNVKNMKNNCCIKYSTPKKRESGVREYKDVHKRLLEEGNHNNNDNNHNNDTNHNNRKKVKVSEYIKQIQDSLYSSQKEPSSPHTQVGGECVKETTKSEINSNILFHSPTPKSLRENKEIRTPTTPSHRIYSPYTSSTMTISVYPPNTPSPHKTLKSKRKSNYRANKVVQNKGKKMLKQMDDKLHSPYMPRTLTIPHFLANSPDNRPPSLKLLENVQDGREILEELRTRYLGIPGEQRRAGSKNAREKVSNYLGNYFGKRLKGQMGHEFNICKAMNKDLGYNRPLFMHIIPS